MTTATIDQAEALKRQNEALRAGIASAQDAILLVLRRGNPTPSDRDALQAGLAEIQIAWRNATKAGA